MANKLCPNCHSEIPEDSKFCFICGSNLEQTKGIAEQQSQAPQQYYSAPQNAAQVPPVQQQPPYTPYNNYPNNNNGSNKGLIAILIAVGVALLGIIILLILLLTRDNTVSTTPTETPVTQTDSTATTVEEEAPRAEEAAAPVYKPSFQEGGTFSFSGSISGAGGIRMTLTNNGGDVSGSYYYTRYGKPLYLSGSCYGNHMTLYGDHEIWEGTVTGSSYSGTMTNTNTDRSFRFRTKY